MQNTNTQAYTRGNHRPSGIRSYEHLANVWGVKVDDLTTEAHKDAAAKAKAFKKFRLEQQAPDPVTFILENEPEKWQAGLSKLTTAHATAEYVEQNYSRINGVMEQRAKNTLYDNEALAHLADVLDVDSAQEQVINAAAALGHKLHKPQDAAIASPAAFAAYMDGIAKIVALTCAVEGRTRRAALYSTVPDLKPMRWKKDGLGKIERYYTKQDVAAHQAAHDYDRDMIHDQTITRLALGEYSGLTLSVSLDPAVLAKRAARLAGAGATERI